MRLIARLDIKGDNLIKGVHLEGLRIVGPPSRYSVRYYEAGIDELIFIDCVASLYGRNHLSSMVSEAASNVFVPITVGGGIRSVEDARSLLRAGADKIAINTAAVHNPSLIQEISNEFGSQCMVIYVEAKKTSATSWEVFTDNARESTGLCAIQWASKAVQLGAGELLLTSIDREGTRTGFDVDLIKAISSTVNCPIIASGGMGTPEHMTEAYNAGADAIATADLLHYSRITVSELRDYALDHGLPVRPYV